MNNLVMIALGCLVRVGWANSEATAQTALNCVWGWGWERLFIFFFSFEGGSEFFSLPRRESSQRAGVFLSQLGFYTAI